MKTVPKVSESVEAIAVTEPQMSEDEVFVVSSTSPQDANLQETVSNVGQATPENAPEKARPN